MELGYLGGSSEISKEHTPGFMPRCGSRDQNLGHLCNAICICVKSFSNVYISVTYHKDSYLNFGYQGGSSEIPKEHNPGFSQGSGLGVKT